MENNQNEKALKTVSKSFLAVGPTLHYSHKNVQRYWTLALALFSISCLFWSKIQTGEFFSCNPRGVFTFELWYMGRFVVEGVSIFEYPWQIFVLGLLMGVIAVVPVLVSQLMSVRYSIPFILAVYFLADLPVFAICLLVSCIAAACRPLRFRSRYIAIALCMAPQLLYWAYFGGVRGVEPVKWGYSFAPWIFAWLTGLAIAGFVLGIGHFTRYRPGLVWVFTAVTLLLAVFVFELKIGFDELDYQLYVAKNNPEKMVEFHDHSITGALDKTISNDAVKRYLAGYFYPTEPIALRKKLKQKIQAQLILDRWPSVFIAGEELRYQEKRDWLIEQYDLFINRRPESRRMPIALYYKALLNEYSPDIQLLGEKEVLHFYSDYPFEKSQSTWYQLYSDFGGSPESIEARWRIAKHWAGQGMFEEADVRLVEAQQMIAERMEEIKGRRPRGDTLFSPFSRPADSAVTASDLEQLQLRINGLRLLLSEENRTKNDASRERLARFITLNPYEAEYFQKLEELLNEIGKDDPLRDNILFEQAKLIADDRRKAEKFSELHENFQKTDGGMMALYELALLKVGFWRQQSESNIELKKKYSADAKAALESFISLYSDSFYSGQIKGVLERLPVAE